MFAFPSTVERQDTYLLGSVWSSLDSIHRTEGFLAGPASPSTKLPPPCHQILVTKISFLQRIIDAKSEPDDISDLEHRLSIGMGRRRSCTGASTDMHVQERLKTTSAALAKKTRLVGSKACFIIHRQDKVDGLDP